MTSINEIDPKFTKYAEDVLSGKIIAGELVRLACERYMSYFERDDIYFDPDRAEKPIRFISHLRHFEGEYAGKNFELQEWQKFLVYAICGWIRKDNDSRLVRNAYIQISRKCGKTSIASALGLYFLIADGEAGAEVDCVSPSSEQTKIAFKKASAFVESINKFKLFRPMRGEIRYDKTKSRFRIMSSDASLGDGFNCSTAIVDEYHAMKNNDIPNVLVSGMGYRKQPLMLYITTAGFDLMCPCKKYRDMCEEILRGVKEDDTIFALIYEMDPEDDWKDSHNWYKCTPSLGITVHEDYMRQQMQMAVNNSSEERAILTKTFNKWINQKNDWLAYNLLLDNTKSFNVEDFKDEKKVYGIMGIDLAATSDLTSVSLSFLYDEKVWVKTWIFIPESALTESPNKYLYNQWKEKGYVLVTPGNATDYDYILKLILEVNKSVKIWKVFYDKWNATTFTEQAIQQRINMIPYSQSLGNFNSPTKEFERLLKLNKIVLDDNECVRWCIMNATLKEDWNGNTKPVKGGNKYEKIDAVISILESLGGMLESTQFKHFFTSI